MASQAPLQGNHVTTMNGIQEQFNFENFNEDVVLRGKLQCSKGITIKANNLVVLGPLAAMENIILTAKNDLTINSMLIISGKKVVLQFGGDLTIVTGIIAQEVIQENITFRTQNGRVASSPNKKFSNV